MLNLLVSLPCEENDVELKMGLCNSSSHPWKMYFETRTDNFMKVVTLCKVMGLVQW